MGRKQWSKWGRGNNIKHQQNKTIKKKWTGSLRYRRRENLVLHAFGNTARRDVMYPLPVNKYAQCLPQSSRSWKERTMCSFLSRHLNTYIITCLIIPRNFPINTLPDILLHFSSKSSRFSHAYNNRLIIKIYIHDVLKFLLFSFIIFHY
jgi:hypothetical protein